MEELLRVMNNYWSGHEAVEADGRYMFFSENYGDADYEKMMDLLWKHLFIGSRWNPDTRSMLIKNGYRCWIGDGDSFGILVACITKDGKTLSVG